MTVASASGPQVCCITALDLVNAYFRKRRGGKGVRGIHREAPVAEGRGFHGNEEAKTCTCCRSVDHVYDDQDYPVY
ncbi:hypothetical protein NEUTE1DRAFT_103752 [Neurospora tetrasperma FGSC 2508]|uniref:Uncharacterized protein n=1 Tax=Neurospora tetrasperma (strain FGSC 2508 / ATCC MYA-4615 / P0657) TaxID=510951 RepID=F8MX27_NEUT8|nr:uncharacterized protein NEUTE1DRAFT_103752 [Neurospora tetrasperma FGSC 2508]EGO54298.1 hypothetical protein NEUTE1DRAFT_103752 [Neurospora tetrasperma FGSC 2508]